MEEERAYYEAQLSELRRQFSWSNRLRRRYEDTLRRLDEATHSLDYRAALRESLASILVEVRALEDPFARSPDSESRWTERKLVATGAAS